MSRRTLLGRSALYAGGLVAASGGLAGCGTSEADAREVSWSTWGNPGELSRFTEFTADFNKRASDGTTARLVPVPNDSYQPRLLTQLGGGTATDVFYVNDTLISTLIKSKQILPLTDRLNGAGSHSKASEFFDSTWGAARTTSGEIYGVPVDCNPLVLWYNIDVLRDAGITTMPAELNEAGRWTMDAFLDMADKIRKKDLRAAALADDSTAIYSWITAAGGKVYDDGKWVVGEDPRSAETFALLHELIQSKTFTYAGALPEGQGQEALFMSNKLGFAISVGRWVLPIFRENKDIRFDIVPYPSNDGKPSSAHIGIAYMALNAGATDRDRAFDFLSRFVSKEGQIFRLRGQGNAVPSIRGADSVLAGKVPAHGQYFAQARAQGYAAFREEASVLGLNTAIQKKFGKLFSQGGDPKQTLNETTQLVNEAVANGALA